MKALHEKSRLGFALVWIGIYVVGMSLADGLSGLLGVEKLITVLFGVGMSAVLLFWLRRNGLMREYGLRSFRGNAKQYLWFIPLIAITSCNLWMKLKCPPADALVFGSLSMLCVGFLEEVIFRGFLLRALQAQGTGFAIFVSGISFGLGHIINLLNGAPFFSTLMQVCYAAAIGVLFAVIFYKGGSLLPCIISHSLVNMLSVFLAEGDQSGELAVSIALVVVPLAYAAWIWKRAD